ncbi:MAG: hypothetical protein WCB46_06345 [Methanoregula sp.]
MKNLSTGESYDPSTGGRQEERNEASGYFVQINHDVFKKNREYPEDILVNQNQDTAC